MAKVVIGVDGGTTAVKAVAFDLEGEIVATHHEGVPVEYGKNGEAEQDMNLVWEAVATCLREVGKSLAEGTEIVAIGLTGQGDGCWLIGKDGKPVRKAPTWMDGRAGARVQQWVSDGKADAILATTGTTTFPGLPPVLLAELSETEPETIEKAGWIGFCKDWIRFNLTGLVATDYSEASRHFLDVNTATGYSQDLPAKLGLDHAVRLLPEIRPAAGDGGKLTAAAAAYIGLPEGTQVGMGQIDVSVTGAGLGAVNDGQGWLILGTTGFVGALLPSMADRKTDLSMVLATGRGKQVLEFLAPMTGTPNIDWIRDTLGYGAKSWAEIEAEARTVAPGSGGVIYLPYASPGGERAPFLDTNASASWVGMSITTTPAEILRSVYEGVAFSLVECVRLLELNGELIVSGGGFRSDLICEILADATGQVVVRQDAPEAGARGAAVYALVSAGEAADLDVAAAQLSSGLSKFEPNKANLEIYDRTFNVFKQSRTAIRPAWPAMRELRKASQFE